MGCFVMCAWSVDAPIREVFDLKKIIDYRREAIEKRRIINWAGGNITLIAFSKGQSAKADASPFAALMYVLEGRVKVTVNGRNFELKAGEAVILPANSSHAVEAISDFKALCVHMALS